VSAGLGRRDLLGFLLRSRRAADPSPGAGPRLGGDAGPPGGPDLGVGAEPGLDAGLVAFLQSVELAAVAVYRSVLERDLLAGAALEVAASAAGHHDAHAAAFGRVAGVVDGRPNAAVLAEVGTGLEPDLASGAALELLGSVERRVAATHYQVLGMLESPRALDLAASVLPVEAQHVVALGLAGGVALEDVVPPLESADGALDPARYPVEA